MENVEISSKTKSKGTVLVTGGAGYIGSHTCVTLLEQGYDVVVVDNFINSSPVSLERVSKITGKTFPWYRVDLRNREQLAEIFTKHQIDWVIHFAALKAVGESVAQPLRYYENNLNATLSLLTVMTSYNCKKIVFSSSATVYGNPEVLPLTEDCSLRTTNPHGATKLMIEDILRDLCAADKDWTAVILRYFNPVGAHPSGLIGENPQGIPNNLTPYIAQVLTGKLPYLQVFGNDYPTSDGTGVRDYIHVCDLAMGHLQAIATIKQTGVHTYNLGTGKGYSVLDVLHAFEKAAGRQIPYQIKPRRAGDIAACYADPSRAEHDLNWHAIYDLDAMARDLWRFYTENPHGYEK
ncbi:MAG: UDP-glucose 4-epimerase GalE [Clostridia bacterium]|nr:UDP-glucose 4-epimerase GalE [Clostridia bacterium]